MSRSPGVASTSFLSLAGLSALLVVVGCTEHPACDMAECAAICESGGFAGSACIEGLCDCLGERLRPDGGADGGADDDAGGRPDGAVHDAGCRPLCDERECGGDGCGGSCPPGCGRGTSCAVDTGRCVADPAWCADDRSASSALGQAVFEGTTVGATNDLTGSCGGSEAPDWAAFWVAPFAGSFVIDTTGSELDAILHVWTTCDVEERACSDPLGVGAASVGLDLAAGESILVVVDGVASRQGAFTVSVTEACDPECSGRECGDDGCGGECPPGCGPGEECQPEVGLCELVDPFWCADDGSSPSTLGAAVFSGSTAGLSNDHRGSCGGLAASDWAAAWRAPHAGEFLIDTVGSDFDTVLHLWTGCGLDELLCDDDGVAPGGASRATVSLVAAQRILVVVDGHETGSFQVNIAAL